MFLKKLVSIENKIRIRLFLMRFRTNPFFSKAQLNAKKKIYIFLAADYSNLGDVAITYAQTEFLIRHFPDHQIFEIPISQTVEGLYFIKSNVQASDIITTVGGGNFGNLYADIEFLRELVVASFPANRIVIFPLTYDFSNDQEGKRALKRAQKLIGSHRDLTIIAREAVSYELIRDAFSRTKVLLTPDIVMSLDKTKSEFNRSGVVLALRSDKEKKLTDSDGHILHELIRKHFAEVSNYDTHLGFGNLTPDQRIQELTSIWNAYSSAKLVITDRLHGMIFCYITNTPCIVFMNNNHKIITSFEWIKHSTSIFLVTDFSSEKIEELFKMVKNDSIKVNYLDLSARFQPIIEALKKN